MQVDEISIFVLSPAQVNESSDPGDDSATINDEETDWISVKEMYSPPTDIQFTGRGGIREAVTLNKDSLPVEFFNLFVTKNI